MAYFKIIIFSTIFEGQPGFGGRSLRSKVSVQSMAVLLICVTLAKPVIILFY
jgi:hypothetical protein